MDHDPASAGASVSESLQREVLQHITSAYLNSADFNGISTEELAEIVGHDADGIESTIRALAAEGDIYVNFGHEMVNPFILGFPPQSADANAAEIRRRGGAAGAILYPRERVLAEISAGDRYPGAPYSAALATGRAQLSSVFFHAAVLARYRDDPRYNYTLDIGGEIRAQENTPLDTFLTTFSIGFRDDESSDEIVVGVPLRYLHDLSAAEQSYWKSFEHDDQSWLLHPDWVRPHLMGEFPERISPYTAVLMETQLINEICGAIDYPHLFKQTYADRDRPTDFGYLIRPTELELTSFIEQLNKLLIEPLNVKFFERAKLATTEERKDSEGNVYRAQRGTMSMLIAWMERTVTHDPNGLVQSASSILREIRRRRSKTAHSIRDNAYVPSLWGEQRRFIVESYFAIRTVRQLLQSHPRASSVRVPVELDEPRVWPF